MSKYSSYFFLRADDFFLAGDFFFAGGMVSAIGLGMRPTVSPRRSVRLPPATQVWTGSMGKAVREWRVAHLFFRRTVSQRWRIAKCRK